MKWIILTYLLAYFVMQLKINDTNNIQNRSATLFYAFLTG